MKRIFPRVFLIVTLVAFAWVSCQKKSTQDETTRSEVLENSCDYCGSVEYTSIPLSSENNVHVTKIHNTSLSSILSNAFDTLNVNWDTLRVKMGITNISSGYLDFDSVYISNLDTFTAHAICVNYATAQTDSLSYAYSLYTADGVTYSKPMMISTKLGTYAKYIDLTDGTVTTYTLNNDRTVTTTRIDGHFRAAGGGGCGQAVMNCVNDAYTNRGWLSVALTVVSAIIPATVVGIAAACTLKNCF